ncbi:MAG: polyprenyl synthetase family protein [Rikenellaceae bacterium]
MLQKIRQPIQSELELFDSYVAEQFSCDSPLMGEMLSLAISSRGKGLRPTLAMLSAAIHSPQNHIGERAWVAAMMSEMIHLASLIHDDVIDNSSLRRGQSTLNAQWQSRNAILTGDYILGRTLSLGLKSGYYDVVTHLSGVISTLCEGEVIQAHYVSTLDLDFEGYINIVEKKTSSLIAASCSAGAIASVASPEKVEAITRYGNYIGIAFQMQDDILDFCPSSKSGKPSNNDLREGKITLPLLLLLEESTPQESAQIKAMLSACGEDESQVAKLQLLIEESSALPRAREIMEEYIQKALLILEQYPQSVYRDSLTLLTRFITEREV